MVYENEYKWLHLKLEMKLIMWTVGLLDGLGGDERGEEFKWHFEGLLNWLKKMYAKLRFKNKNGELVQRWMFVISAKCKQMMSSSGEC